MVSGSFPPFSCSLEEAGQIRDECVNEHWFLSLAQARTIVEAWRVDYNAVRAHRAP